MVQYAASVNIGRTSGNCSQLETHSSNLLCICSWRFAIYDCSQSEGICCGCISGGVWPTFFAFVHDYIELERNGQEVLQTILANSVHCSQLFVRADYRRLKCKSSALI